MKVEGSCHCGNVRFEAVINERDVSICHCTDCQHLTGTAFRVSAPAGPDEFRILSGKPTTYIKTAESGARRAQGFCGTCGTPLYAANADGPPRAYAIRIGTLRQRAQLAPVSQIWCDSALPWLPEMPDVKRWARDDD